VCLDGILICVVLFVSLVVQIELPL
jgi:hypothetical protein